MPSVLRDVGVRLDDHVELQIFSLIHLHRQTLVGQFMGELGHQPDVGLVCFKKEKAFQQWGFFFQWFVKCCRLLSSGEGGDPEAYLQPAGKWWCCSRRLHSCRCRRCFLCLPGLPPRWSVCSVCQADFLLGSEPSPLPLPSEEHK